MKADWTTAIRTLGWAACLGSCLLLLGCNTSPGGALPGASTTRPRNPTNNGDPPPASTAPVSLRGAANTEGQPPPPPRPEAPRPPAGRQSMHGTVKSLSPDRTSVEVNADQGTSNYRARTPEVLARVAPGDEMDFTVESDASGAWVVAVVVTKQGGATAPPTSGNPPAAAPSPGLPR